jgi:hypothetical protein
LLLMRVSGTENPREGVRPQAKARREYRGRRRR